MPETSKSLLQPAIVSGLITVGAVTSIWGRGWALQPFVAVAIAAIVLTVVVRAGWTASR